MEERYAECSQCKENTLRETQSMYSKYFLASSGQAYWQYKGGSMAHVCNNCVPVDDDAQCLSLFSCQGCGKAKIRDDMHPDAEEHTRHFGSWCYDCYTQCIYCGESGKEIERKHECQECVNILRDLIRAKRESPRPQ